MAQRVTVVLEDDLTGGPAEQTVRFAFDGTDYEIDLSAKNAAAFGKQLAPILSTPAGRGGRRPAGRGGPRPAGSALVISGPGRRSTAWRSVSAAASRPAWWSNTRRPTGDNDKPPPPRGARNPCLAPWSGAPPPSARRQAELPRAGYHRCRPWQPIAAQAPTLTLTERPALHEHISGAGHLRRRQDIARSAALCR
jgi:hypothetical protein